MFVGAYKELLEEARETRLLKIQLSSKPNGCCFPGQTVSLTYENKCDHFILSKSFCHIP